MVGRFIGSFALLYIRAQRALAAVAIVGRHSGQHHHLRPRPRCDVGDRCCGLFNSVMWPCIFPLSLEVWARSPARVPASWS